MFLPIVDPESHQAGFRCEIVLGMIQTHQKDQYSWDDTGLGGIAAWRESVSTFRLVTRTRRAEDIETISGTQFWANQGSRF